MKDIKTFCKENKNKLISVGCIVGVAIIGAVIYTKTDKEEVVNPYAGKDVISWTPEDKFMNLERVKEIIDLNANNSESYAIFKEGVNTDEYSCISLSDGLITEKSEEA